MWLSYFVQPVLVQLPLPASKLQSAIHTVSPSAFATPSPATRSLVSVAATAVLSALSLEGKASPPGAHRVITVDAEETQTKKRRSRRVTHRPSTGRPRERFMASPLMRVSNLCAIGGAHRRPAQRGTSVDS